MKNLIPLLLVGAGAAVLISSSGKKPSSTSKPKGNGSTGPKTEEMKKNEENIKKYFSNTPVPLLSITDMMVQLSENLKDEVYNKKYTVNLTPETASEAFFAADAAIQQSKKAILSPQDADVITKEVLTEIMPDVMWNEGLTPYKLESPFPWVWNSVNLIVFLASKNLVEKGLISI